jgi:Acetyltransferase (GNAT) family
MNGSEQKPALGHNSVRVEIVTTMEQLQHAYAIRAICFMEENGVVAGQSFDGNDFQATHVIAYNGREPIGALRIRWFKDFAKIERSAVRKAYRQRFILKMIAEFAFQHIARKGYSRVVTHASPLYARLWRTLLGFTQVEKPPVQFVGHHEPYVELVKELDVPENAITIDTDATVLFRTEGEWDHASRFEAAVQLSSQMGT